VPDWGFELRGVSRSDRWRRPGLLTVATLVAVLAACGGRGPSEVPAAAATIPPDWVTVTSATGDLQLTLPPWLVLFDTVGAIFANEPPAPGAAIALQLVAYGAGSAEQPPSGDVAAWIDQKLRDVGSGVPSISRVVLPAGPTVRYERIDRAGTRNEWHILAFGIKTPSGYAYLQLDGSPDGWRRRASELEWIAQLVRAR
jgi:predicted small lipoprotein YifL